MTLQNFVTKPLSTCHGGGGRWAKTRRPLANRTHAESEALKLCPMPIRLAPRLAKLVGIAPDAEGKYLADRGEFRIVEYEMKTC